MTRRISWMCTTALCGVVGLMQPVAAQVAVSGAAAAPVRIEGVSKSAAARHAVARLLPLKSTYAVSTIGKKQIKYASPTTTAQTILNQAPSVLATTAGPGGVRTNITFRAFNSGQFSETYDGVSLNDMFNGGVNNQASIRNNVLVTLNDFDGIQIYRGINNPAVNSYNSLGGTINYRPIAPSMKAGGEVGGGYGSYNTYSYHFTLNTGDYHGISQILSYRQDYSGGWLANSKDHNSNLYYAVRAANFGGRGQFYLNFIFNHNSGQTPHTVPLALVTQFGPTYQLPASQGYSNNIDSTNLLVVGEKYSVNSIVTVDLKTFFGHDTYQRTSYANPLFGQSPTQPYNQPNSGTGSEFWLSNPFYPSYNPNALFGSTIYGTDYHLYGQGASELGLQPSVKIALSHNLIQLGGNLTYGNLNSREFWYGSQPVPQINGYNDAWDEHDRRTLGSIYAQDEISLFGNRLKITPGVKYIYANTKNFNATGFYDQPGSVSDHEHYISPTVGANLTLFKGATVYAAFGENIKLPNISAYYGDIGLQNAAGAYVTAPLAIKPEYVKDYEAGLRYERAGYGITVGYYRENFENTFITVTNPSTQVSTQTNGGGSRYSGVELQLVGNFGAIGGVVPGAFTGYFNYSHNNAVFTSTFNSNAAGPVTAGTPLANVPANLVSAGLTWAWQGWHATGNAQYVGRQYLQQANAGTPTSYTQSPYFLLNASIGKSIPVHLGKVKSLEIALNIDNLLNRGYYTRDKIYQTYGGANYNSVLLGEPRAFFGSVTAKF